MYEAPSDRPTEVGSRLSEISRAVVKIHAEHYGRGPDRAKTIWQRDVIVCLLEEVYTPAERIWIQGGPIRPGALAADRVFKDEVEPLLRAAGRGRDRAPGARLFEPVVNADPELASEVFVLEPLEQAEALGQEL